MSIYPSQLESGESRRIVLSTKPIKIAGIAGAYFEIFLGLVGKNIALLSPLSNREGYIPISDENILFKTMGIRGPRGRISLSGA